MIHAILLSDSVLAAELAKKLGMHAVSEFPSPLYRKGEWYLFHGMPMEQMISIAREEISPDFFSIAYAATSHHTEHIAGDVVLPNVLLAYDDAIELGDVNESNRDGFLKDALFLEQYDRQEDIDFGEFGLSIGGILVENVPTMPSEELIHKMHIAYEADAFITEWSGIRRHMEDTVFDRPYFLLAGIQSAHRKTVDNDSLSRYLAATLQFLHHSMHTEETGEVEESDDRGIEDEE